jgi:PPIC-type PPIASE domain
LRANTTTIDDAEEKSSDIIDRTEESNSQEYQRADRELLLRQYQQSQWGHLIATRFLEIKSELDRVLFSAIQVADLHLAHELYCRICEQGASFTKLATLYSQRPAAKMGGAVGPISISKLHPLIHHHLIGLKPKQLSPIFQMDEQYVFLKLECWLPARFDRQMQQQLLNELFEEWLHNRIVDRIGTIGRTAEICNDVSEIRG